MVVAALCLGERRRDWALAMQGEFQSAIEDGHALRFATGCLIAAWRQMPAQEQGRFVIANYALALGMFVPMAVLQLEFVAGLPFLSLGPSGLYAMLTPDSVQGPFLIHAYSSAIPVLVALWTLLGIGHLRLAWLLLERDWSRVARIGALTVAASATLVVFTVVLFLDDAGVHLQAALLAAELTAVYGLARWHARAFPDTPSARFVR